MILLQYKCNGIKLNRAVSSHFDALGEIPIISLLNLSVFFLFNFVVVVSVIALLFQSNL